KYIGYKGYANFISSDNDFLVLRRFDSLSARVALGLQDEITVLEEELDELDAKHSKRESEDVHNGTLRGDVTERTALLDIIAKRLRKYSQNWHLNHDYSAIAPEEQRYLDKRDLVRVVRKEKTPLRRVIDSSLRLRTLPLWKHKVDETSNYDAKHVSYYSDKRIDGFASAAIIAIGVIMLIAPIWILQSLDTLIKKLDVITIFVLAFLLLVSFAMVARPFEVLGATAAYAAVLMVFIQFGIDT
ncbi:hypothetical protein B0H67DRAFT_496968, partial [Lasiosphaeris hirsuta]